MKETNNPLQIEQKQHRRVFLTLKVVYIKLVVMKSLISYQLLISNNLGERSPINPTLQIFRLYLIQLLAVLHAQL